MNSTISTTTVAARHLKAGQRVLSSSGKILTVTKTIQKENKTVILFDGDMEVDFDPYLGIKTVDKIA